MGLSIQHLRIVKNPELKKKRRIKEKDEFLCTVTRDKGPATLNRRVTEKRFTGSFIQESFRNFDLYWGDVESCSVFWEFGRIS